MDNELGAINLSQNGASLSEAEKRVAKRLSRNKNSPTSQQLSGSWVNWDDINGLLGQPFDSTKISLSKLDQMRRDPMIAFGLAFKIVPLIRATWHIESENALKAAFVEGALRQIYSRFVLGYCNALSFGYSAGVKNFEYQNPDWTYVEPDDPDRIEKEVWPHKNVDALVWKAFTWLDPRSVRPHFNAAEDFDGFDFVPYGYTGSPSAFGTSGYAITSSDQNPTIPLERTIWAVNEKDSMFGSLYGYPLIGHAFRYWWSYWYKFGLSDRAFEKWADPPIKAYHPAEPGRDSNGEPIDLGAVALGIAEQLRSGANIAIPTQVLANMDARLTNIKEWDFQQMESTADFTSLIQSFEYLDVLKLRAVMVPEQGLIEGGKGTGSRNVAEEFGDRLQEAQAVLMEEIDFHINRYLIPQLLEVNFGAEGESCTKVTTGFDPKDVETMRAIVGAIANKTGEIAEVDRMQLLKHLGVPTLSHAAIQLKVEQLAAEQDQQHQREVAVLREQASLKGHKIDEKTGQVVKPGDKISLSEDDQGFWRRIAMKLSKDEKSREEKEKEKLEELLTQFTDIGGKISELAEREPNIHVDVVVPDAPKVEEKLKKTRKVINRDKDGNIISVEEFDI